MEVRHYVVTLTTEGLVHIGTGEKMGKKDYFRSDGDTVAVINPAKFANLLTPEQMETYCKFLEEPSRFGLEDFLSSDPTLKDKAKKSIAYQCAGRLAKGRHNTNQYFEVASCIKDVYGRPYVPGSSVKGMLRTALLNSIILADRSRYEVLYDRSKVRNASKEAGQGIEHKAFFQAGLTEQFQNAVNDIMRYISVSDSEPLSSADLVFAKKYDKFAKTDNGQHKRNRSRFSNTASSEGNEISLYRECIKPGTRITFSLDIDARIDEHLPFGFGSLDAKKLQAVLQENADLYKLCFLASFDADADGEEGGQGEAGRTDGRCSYVYQGGPFKGARCRNTAVEGTAYCHRHQDKAGLAGKSVEATCYLGGGVDFDSKTVVNALFEDPFDRLNETAHILYRQFPTKIDRGKHPGLWRDVEEAGFVPKPMNTKYRKTKDDHRHWRDGELGVSPHTLKYGKVGNRRYLMGKCKIRIEERA